MDIIIVLGKFKFAVDFLLMHNVDGCHFQKIVNYTGVEVACCLYNVLSRDPRVRISMCRSGLAFALGSKRELDLSDFATKSGSSSHIALFAFPEQFGLVEVAPEL